MEDLGGQSDSTEENTDAACTWTMSLSANLPLDEIRISSPSNSSMAEEKIKTCTVSVAPSPQNPEWVKSSCVTHSCDAQSLVDLPSNSAGPTPTMMSDMGRPEACGRGAMKM